MRWSHIVIETSGCCTPCSVCGQTFPDPNVPNGDVMYFSDSGTLTHEEGELIRRVWGLDPYSEFVVCGGCRNHAPGATNWLLTEDWLRRWEEVLTPKESVAQRNIESTPDARDDAAGPAHSARSGTDLRLPDDAALREKYSKIDWVEEEGRGHARAAWAEKKGYEYVLFPNANGCYGMFARTDITIRRPLTKREIDERVEAWKQRFERVRYLRQFPPADRRYIRRCLSDSYLGPRCFEMQWATRRSPANSEEVAIWLTLTNTGIEGWQRYADWLDLRGEPGLAHKIRNHIASQTRPRQQRPLASEVTIRS